MGREPEVCVFSMEYRSYSKSRPELVHLVAAPDQHWTPNGRHGLLRLAAVPRWRAYLAPPENYQGAANKVPNSVCIVTSSPKPLFLEEIGYWLVLQMLS
jgi:hypothetical protein